MTSYAANISWITTVSENNIMAQHHNKKQKGTGVDMALIITPTLTKANSHIILSLFPWGLFILLKLASKTVGTKSFLDAFVFPSVSKPKSNKVSNYLKGGINLQCGY